MLKVTGPRHRRTGYFVARRLFERLEGFADLEARIAALPTQQDRGDAFEVFAEAYLATQKLVGAEEVWPADQVPWALRWPSHHEPARDCDVIARHENACKEPSVAGSVQLSLGYAETKGSGARGLRTLPGTPLSRRQSTSMVPS